MLTHARAIFWAQLKTIRNLYPRGNYSRHIVTIALAGLWYSMWAFGATAAAIVLAETDDTDRLHLILSHGLMAALLYWQLIPILLVCTGASLDIKRLRIYPIPVSALFRLDLLLRLTSGIEMLLVLAGASVGLTLNQAVPFWACAALIPFVLLNLFLAAGLRNLLERLLARKYIREIGFLVIVSAAALPQFLFIAGLPAPVRRLISSPPEPWWPWSAGANAIAGDHGPAPWIVLAGWTLICYAFGRRQFERGLRFDRATADVRRSRAGLISPLANWAFSLPSAILPDPYGILVEKEIRSMSRAPRFRLVFIMGFTFSMLIWLPIAIREGLNSGSFFVDNYLTFVSLYALLLLGEASFWNAFGFDRGAAQVYFLVGAPAHRVLVGKNLAALVFVLLEVMAVAVVCAALGMPVTGTRLAEAILVTLVLALYMFAAGNLGSTRYPRPVDPRQSWRSAATSRFQALLLLVYPLIALPVGLAFLARFAFDSQLAFYGVLAFAALLGGVIYWIALESAVATLYDRQESVLATLAEGQGPISTT